MTSQHVAVLSGGSEIVSAALVEEFLSNGFRPVIIALGRNSILRSLAKQMPFEELEWPPADPASTANHLAKILKTVGATENRPIPIFPTEDGGLRLLLETRERIEPWGVFGSARALGLGGLDKAELFSFLDRTGCADLIAPFRIAADVPEAISAVAEFDGDAVIKPALKPLSMNMAGMRAKAFLSRDFNETQALEGALKAVWHLSNRWVIQPRLRVPPAGETVVWAVRDSAGETHCIAANGIWKWPRHGGTACWVRIASDPAGLFANTKTLLEKLNFIGVCEVEFLLNDNNEYRSLELNPRPWLQIGLPFRAGVPMASAAARALQNETIQPFPTPRSCSWVNIERLALAAFSGEQGGRLDSTRVAWRAWRSAIAVGIHDTNLLGVRRRWLLRVLLRLLNVSRG